MTGGKSRRDFGKKELKKQGSRREKEEPEREDAEGKSSKGGGDTRRAGPLLGIEIKNYKGEERFGEARASSRHRTTRTERALHLVRSKRESESKKKKRGKEKGYKHALGWGNSKGVRNGLSKD